MTESIQTQVAPFDYAALDSETRIIVQQRTGEIKTLMRRSAQDIIDIGLKLTDVKARLGHGHFGVWLEAEFEWSERTAQRYIGVAESFKSDTVSDLTKFEAKALYLLASPSTPEPARLEALVRAEAGETITYTKARDIKASHEVIPSLTAGTSHTEALVPAREAPADPEPAEAAPLDEEEVPDPDDRDIDQEPDVRLTADPSSSFGVVLPSPFVDEVPQGRHKPKTNRAGDEETSSPFDRCQTPAYALDPLLPYLNHTWTIWEPAAGEGLLVEALYDGGWPEHAVIASDLLTGQNFFEAAPEVWDCLITNPPYSIKFLWLERCYELGKPFALLVPVETLGAKTAQVLLQKYGFEIMLLNQRVDFKMPLAGWDGDGAQFPVMWLCWNILPEKVMFGDITEGKKRFSHE